jgi:hypothetical protein
VEFCVVGRELRLDLVVYAPEGIVVVEYVASRSATLAAARMLDHEVDALAHDDGGQHVQLDGRLGHPGDDPGPAAVDRSGAHQGDPERRQAHAWFPLPGDLDPQLTVEPDATVIHYPEWLPPVRAQPCYGSVTGCPSYL